MLYFDINAAKASKDISVFFPNWKDEKESVAVFSPHDDDALIGAGYAICAALENHANVFVFIFCKGDAGYSRLELKEKIVGIRQKETYAAYEKLGVPQENIIYMGYSDFSVWGNVGWKVGDGLQGTFHPVVKMLREKRITRLLIPNHYREHIDHTAVHWIGGYDAPQAGDPVLVDWAAPNVVESVVEYSVWADLSPQDALVNGRDTSLRANWMLVADAAVEKKIADGIYAYESQGAIIENLVKNREGRRTSGGAYIEVYLAFDPRPPIPLKPYIEFFEKHNG